MPSESPNSKKPLVDVPSQASMQPLMKSDVSVNIPEGYASEGYLGSKATVVSSLDGSNDELKVVIDNGPVKGGFDSDDSGSAESDDVISNCARLEAVQGAVDTFLEEHKRTLEIIALVLLLIGYAIYFVWALVLDFERATALFVITLLVVISVAYALIKKQIGGWMNTRIFKPVQKFGNSNRRVLKWVSAAVLLACFITFVIVDIKPAPKQFISLGGLALFVLLMFVFSKHPSKVDLRPVVWGFALQFLFGILILRTTWGYDAFRFLGKEINQFLKYTDYGSEFVFGKLYENHFFAFKVLPVIVFFSCAISALYHVGAMQFIIGKIAWVMQVTMATAATESLSCAGNIFVGQTEAPILIRPFLESMTKSELHAVMTGGFATIAGGVLAAYILFGVPAEHLLCASVMNAPVALAVSKLFYPETEESKTKKFDQIVMEKGTERNLIEAAAAGASQSIMLVANIAANLIAFLAMLAFINATLSWFGGMVGYPEFSFQMICSYLFMPVAFMMGVDWEDCSFVAELLGIKIFLNEFVAYEELSKYIHNRENCTFPQISVRSEVIATYALCGFANLSSIGIQLGGIGPMAPSRKGDLAKIAVRALIAGTVATLMTACIAGFLTPVDVSNVCLNGTLAANFSSIANSTVNVTIVTL
ncbi:solute carrier family 28 member 3 [Lingula anatina]|uniref:Sodium/nucleoside cotransporter n=1 Tax=Lingula anatina TaxID=7574 RepID=A0A1S3JKS3_LINAN|nr:solute carrier family 28 member 3 [Lingula anatina]XP_013410731.1 solute carrier family 28 member 3 [Lingula anatina]|eukprot:XP_013410730.1 solute carrier family 28 member 3 [Lingula anatina]